jgi:septal ring factor EnvC (AmiA/AmiB activator)
LKSLTDILASINRPKPTPKTRWFILFCIALLALPFSLGAQQRKQLEDKRKQLIKEIKLTTKRLDETKKSKEATYVRYITLQRQIKTRRELIETLETEVSYTQESINQAQLVIQSLQEDIERLKGEYSELARVAYRQKVNKTNLAFLFSAKSFNEAFRRWRYIRQYNDYREKQARLIMETQEMLADKLSWLESQRQEKETLLEDAKAQAGLLNKELADKNQLLQTLKKDESRLATELKQKEKTHQQLNNAIEVIIREEMAKARRKGRKSDASTNSSSTDAPSVVVTDFAQQKGRLLWPVSNGVVTSFFGRQEHATIKGLQITNNGIDIQTDLNATVRSVHKGQVVGTQFIPGHQYMVIIKHGQFYTVYSNLEEIFVKRNAAVNANQKIGTVSKNSKTNTAEVHFEVWKEKTRMDPLTWIKKR